jgi:hypothetical protein
MLIKAAQKGLPLRKMESLMAERRSKKCVQGVKRTLLVVGGRSKRYIRVAYDQEYLPCAPGGPPSVEAVPSGQPC